MYEGVFKGILFKMAYLLPEPTWDLKGRSDQFKREFRYLYPNWRKWVRDWWIQRFVEDSWAEVLQSIPVEEEEWKQDKERAREKPPNVYKTQYISWMKTGDPVATLFNEANGKELMRQAQRSDPTRLPRSSPLFEHVLEYIQFTPDQRYFPLFATDIIHPSFEGVPTLTLITEDAPKVITYSLKKLLESLIQARETGEEAWFANAQTVYALLSDEEEEREVTHAVLEFPWKTEDRPQFTGDLLFRGKWIDESHYLPGIRLQGKVRRLIFNPRPRSPPLVQRRRPIRRCRGTRRASAPFGAPPLSSSPNQRGSLGGTARATDGASPSCLGPRSRFTCCLYE